MDLDNRTVIAGGRGWRDVEDGIGKIKMESKKTLEREMARVRAPKGGVGRGRSEGESDSRG